MNCRGPESYARLQIQKYDLLSLAKSKIKAFFEHSMKQKDFKAMSIAVSHPRASMTANLAFCTDEHILARLDRQNLKHKQVVLMLAFMRIKVWSQSFGMENISTFNLVSE